MRNHFIKKASIIGVFMLLNYIASSQTNKIDSSEMVTIRIDPDQARGASVSQIFEHVEFIPLETTNESLFGRVSQLNTTKDNFIIYDSDTRSILIFDKGGKFKNKIDSRKMQSSGDEGRKHNFSGFTLKDEDNFPRIEIRSGNDIYEFNVKGELLKTSKVDPSLAKYFFPIYKLSGPEIEIKFNQPVRNDKSENHYELILLKNQKVIANYFEYDKAIKNKDFLGRFGDQIFDNGEKNTLYYVGWVGDMNIYKIVPDKVMLAYQLILPNNFALPADFSTSPAYYGKKNAYLKSNETKYYQIGNGYKMGDNLFFNILNSASGRKSFLYNLKHRTLISMRNLEPDQSSFYLPVTDEIYDYYGFHLFKDGYLYNSYSSAKMFDSMNQSKGKNPKYNATLEKYFASSDKKSNPVLIKLKTRN